jgi:hypothetical protein
VSRRLTLIKPRHPINGEKQRNWRRVDRLRFTAQHLSPRPLLSTPQFLIFRFPSVYRLVPSNSRNFSARCELHPLRCFNSVASADSQCS